MSRDLKIVAAAIAAFFSFGINSASAQSVDPGRFGDARRAQGAEARFGDYASQPYAGVRAKPLFTGANRKYRTYQTEIRRGFASNPLFAGNFVLIGVGCGTGCMFVYVGDVKTGNIFDFPLGGEDHYMLQYDTRPTSRLVKVTWNQMSDGGTKCIKEDLVFSGSTFSRRKTGSSNKMCPWK